MASKLDKAILSVLSFYAIFEYPLTEDEIWENLLFYKDDKLSFDKIDLAQSIANLVEQKILFSEHALYGVFPLKNELFYLDKRRLFYRYYYLKLKKARAWSKLLAIFPGVRLVALVNSVAMKMPKESSDLDFFIITDKKSLWISRFFITAFLKLFGLRPGFVDDKDTICTSFWISEKELNLSKIKRRYFDVYLFYWLFNVIPLYDAAAYYEKFQTSNQWKKRFLPQAHDEAYRPLLGNLSFFSKSLKKIGEFIFIRQVWQKFFKKIQCYYFPDNIKKMMNKDSRVVVNDNMLKFHTVDNRDKYWEKYNENFNNLLSKYNYVSKS